MLLLGFSEASLRLLRSVSWASQKEPKTLKKKEVMFGARQGLGGEQQTPPEGAGTAGPPKHVI